MSLRNAQIHPSALVHDNVGLGEWATIGPYVILGEPRQGKLTGEDLLSIGQVAVFRSHSIIYAGSIIGEGFQTGHHVLIRENSRIGNDAFIGSHCNIEPNVIMGDRVHCHSHAFVGESSILEDDCWIGPGAALGNQKYPQATKGTEVVKGPVLHEFVKIGANAVVMPNLTLGRYALIGAGAVVTHNVPDYAVVVGNPAKVMGDVRELPYKIHEELLNKPSDEN